VAIYNLSARRLGVTLGDPEEVRIPLDSGKAHPRRRFKEKTPDTKKQISPIKQHNRGRIRS